MTDRGFTTRTRVTTFSSRPSLSRNGPVAIGWPRPSRAACFVVMKNDLSVSCPVLMALQRGRPAGEIMARVCGWVRNCFSSEFVCTYHATSMASSRLCGFTFHHAAPVRCKRVFSFFRGTTAVPWERAQQSWQTFGVGRKR